MKTFLKTAVYIYIYIEVRSRDGTYYSISFITLSSRLLSIKAEIRAALIANQIKQVCYRNDW